MTLEPVALSRSARLRLRAMPHVVAIGAMLVATLLLGCAGDTRIEVSARYDDAWGLVTFEVDVRDTTRTLPAQSQFTIVLPGDWAGEPVPFQVWGIDAAGTKKAYAGISVTPRSGATVSATLEFRLPDCEMPCVEGTKRCEDDAIATCVAVDRCSLWVVDEVCGGATPFCVGGACSGMCADDCVAGSLACDGFRTALACGQADEDECLDWTTTACGAGTECVAGTCAQCTNPTTFTTLRPPNPMPNVHGIAMAYDAARQRVVIFPELFQDNGSEFYNRDVWLWDGTDFTKVTPAHRPPSLVNPVMAYDAARERVVLFARSVVRDGQRFYNKDVWLWDGTDFTQVTPATMTENLEDIVMAYDAARERVVVFADTVERGGQHFYNRDVYLWDGADFTKVTPANPTPNIEDLAMAYDAARQRVVLFAAILEQGDQSFYNRDVWLWDGADFTKVTPSNPMANVTHLSAAYDPSRNAVAVFPDRVEDNDMTYYNRDVWLWNGADFTAAAPAPITENLGGGLDFLEDTPGHAMAYDVVRRQLVLYVDSFSDNDMSYYNRDIRLWNHACPQ